MNSSEDLSDKLAEEGKKVKFARRRNKLKDSKKDKEESSSAASSVEDENDDYIGSSPNSSNNRNSIINSNASNNNSYGNIYRKYRKRHVWEVMEGYRDPNMKITQPENYEGVLLKRRNWPMKGWHKRYFMLVDGMLSYGKSKSDITKNKLHGTVNTFFSIVSYITSSRRILIDFSTTSNAFVCHLKAKTQTDFDAWIEHLKHHRRYYQSKYSQTNTSHGTLNRQNSVSIQNNSTQNNSITISNLTSLQKQSENEITQFFPAPRNTEEVIESKVKKTQLLNDNDIENKLKQTEESLVNLSKTLGLVSISNNATPRASVVGQVNQVQVPQKNSSHHHQASSISFDYLNTNSNVPKNIHVSRSNPNLINNEFLATNNNNNNNNNSNNMKTVSSTSNTTASTSINSTCGNKSGPTLNVSNLNVVGSLVDAYQPHSSIENNSFFIGTPPSFSITDTNTASCSNFSTASTSNENETNQLNFYQDAKIINDQLNFIYQQLLHKQKVLVNVNSQQSPNIDSLNAPSRTQRSQSVMSSISLQDSQLQFYDAIEYFTSESESDDSDDGSDDGSGGANKSNQAIVPEELQGQKMLTRRRNLPAPAPDTSQVSVWGILRKAIGKDLSKIALPVILNEPIGILQRLCEELEYSDLLDAASTKQDPYDRMVAMAAFVISGYASSYYRNGAKDFNPLLGETYELTRPDKGWKYVAEQVSHHPPISATHCQSKTFVHEQIFHAKIKFWGRSMEVHPEGYTRVTLPKFDETYQWNKIVMFVSNLTGSQRKIEHNGEITIRCTNGVSCTITFPKASYSSQKNEFYGDVIFDNVVKRKIFGQWHETFLCGTDNTAKTIWRMGAMPEDNHLYYGFTRFAIELNEFTENLKEDLPPTDSRFRPDQRLFENGKVDEAELEKQRIEEKQRDRRREFEAKGTQHTPLWFTFDKANSNSSRKEYTFDQSYWTKRESPGFKNLNTFQNLW